MTKDENNVLSFEEALSKLEDCAEKLNDPALSLEDSIKAYEEGSEYYLRCEKILDSAKQRIEDICEEGGSDDKPS